MLNPGKSCSLCWTGPTKGSHPCKREQSLSICKRSVCLTKSEPAFIRYSCSHRDSNPEQPAKVVFWVKLLHCLCKCQATNPSLVSLLIWQLQRLGICTDWPVSSVHPHGSPKHARDNRSEEWLLENLGPGPGSSGQILAPRAQNPLPDFPPTPFPASKLTIHSLLASCFFYLVSPLYFYFLFFWSAKFLEQETNIE